MKMFKNSSATKNTKKQKMIHMKNIFVVFVFFVAVLAFGGCNAALLFRRLP